MDRDMNIKDKVEMKIERNELDTQEEHNDEESDGEILRLTKVEIFCMNMMEEDKCSALKNEVSIVTEDQEMNNKKIGDNSDNSICKNELDIEVKRILCQNDSMLFRLK